MLDFCWICCNAYFVCYSGLTVNCTMKLGLTVGLVVLARLVLLSCMEHTAYTYEYMHTSMLYRWRCAWDQHGWCQCCWYQWAWCQQGRYNTSLSRQLIKSMPTSPTSIARSLKSMSLLWRHRAFGQGHTRIYRLLCKGSPFSWEGPLAFEWLFPKNST